MLSSYCFSFIDVLYTIPSLPSGTDITSLPNADALKIYNEAMKDDVIKIKRTRSHSFLKDKLELEQKAATPPTISLDVPDRVLKESKEAPRPVPKLRDDGEPPREAAIEAPSSVVAISTPSEDVKRHVFSIELVKGKKLFFFVFCVLFNESHSPTS